jgi:hypothetical protein
MVHMKSLLYLLLGLLKGEARWKEGGHSRKYAVPPNRKAITPE